MPYGASVLAAQGRNPARTLSEWRAKSRAVTWWVKRAFSNPAAMAIGRKRMETIERQLATEFPVKLHGGTKKGTTEVAP